MPHFTVDMTVRDYELDQYGVGYLMTSESCRAVHQVQYSHTLLHRADSVTFCTAGRQQCCVSLIPASIVSLQSYCGRRPYIVSNLEVLALQVCQLPAAW